MKFFYFKGFPDFHFLVKDASLNHTPPRVYNLNLRSVYFDKDHLGYLASSRPNLSPGRCTCRVSWDNMKQQECRLQNCCCWPDEAKEPTQSAKLVGKGGLASVVNGRLIPFYCGIQPFYQTFLRDCLCFWEHIPETTSECIILLTMNWWIFARSLPPESINWKSVE